MSACRGTGGKREKGGRRNSNNEAAICLETQK
jgi:hypothetical protein